MTMAEATASELEIVEPTTTDAAAADVAVDGVESNLKRTREDSDDEEDGVSKKRKVDEEEKKPSGPVKLGFKSFASSLEMFDYFYNLLHAWPAYLNLNQVFQHLLPLSSFYLLIPFSQLEKKKSFFFVFNLAMTMHRCYLQYLFLKYFFRLNLVNSLVGYVRKLSFLQSIYLSCLADSLQRFPEVHRIIRKQLF